MANRPKKTIFTIITKTQIKVTAFPLYPGATFLRKKYTALGEWAQHGYFHTLQVTVQTGPRLGVNAAV